VRGGAADARDAPTTRFYRRPGAGFRRRRRKGERCGADDHQHQAESLFTEASGARTWCRNHRVVLTTGVGVAVVGRRWLVVALVMAFAVGAGSESEQVTGGRGRVDNDRPVGWEWSCHWMQST